MTESIPTLNPGSKEALAAGCKCPVMDNARGKGDDRGNFWISGKCPIHAPKLGKCDV